MAQPVRAIRAIRLCKSYPTRTGPRQILCDVDFELQFGQKLGILGRNGAGKSSLIRLISEAEEPTSGRIDRTMSVSWPLAFGGAFQSSLTGRDNVRFISRIYNSDYRKNVEAVEDFAELGTYLDEPVKVYSSGMRARLAFALSMIIEFDCFLIDEAASVGDSRFTRKCEYELFQKRHDRSMIIVSHDVGYVRDHCTVFGVLDSGRFTLFSTFAEAQDSFENTMTWTPPETAADPAAGV
ncbi:ABC transporter ATP-binding protein [Novosphingobium sp. FSW06-99]|uniref:ABC transporter ATP-binding protein n=1 Tax=Novosphingobium sp. FSW06-99 TaxID=1739113 RepID=UPI00076C9DFD|nr:ABC transporter ATP-binding protein [Novosphingobium sp. FSW06-99]KUR76843.1 ATP-binding protein [Novosphingobium sp. FSW06-99]